MAIVGNAGVVKYGDDTVAEVRSYSIELTADTIETSNMGDTSRQYVKGLSAFSGTADVYWDPTHFATAGAGDDANVDWDGSIQGAVGTAGTTLEVYPEGVSDGSKWAGSVIITGYSISGSFDGLVEASVSFQGTGSLTYTD